MARDRLLELQQRSATVAAAAPRDPDPDRDRDRDRDHDPAVVTVNRPGRLSRLLRRPPPPPARQPQPADEFLSKLADLTQQLAEASSDVDEVSRQQCRQLNSPRHQQEAWQQTQQLATAALGRLSKLRGRLDQLQAQLGAASPDLSQTQAHMIQIQINSARSQLLSVVQHFNQQEMDFRERKRDHLKRQLQITGESVDDEQLEALLDQGDAQVFNQGILMRVECAREQLNEAEDRYQQIRSLETSIEQLHEMFQQLSLLVHDQGELVDRIGKNTASTALAAEKGQQELGSAVQKQKQSRKMMIGCGIVLGVVMLILLIVLVSYLG